jgi:acyl carrier protein
VGTDLSRHNGEGQDPAAIGDAVEAFIRRRFDVSDNDAYFNRRTNLWDEGYVDSLGMTELVVFLEATFGIKLPQSALFSPEFTQVDGIAALIAEIKATRT